METMSYKIKVELSAKAYSQIVNNLPLVEGDSILKELSSSLRYLVADSHPVSLTQIPWVQSMHLHLSLQTGPEAVLVRVFGKDVIVFVDGYQDGGKVIGVVSVGAGLFRHLFGPIEGQLFEEVDRRMPFSQLPTWESWASFCREWDFNPCCLESLIPAAKERGEDQWVTEYDRELASS
jgi:hypothetical protein